MVLQLICFCCSWGLTLLACWIVYRALIDGMNHLKRLHQIPCNRCAFFTNNYVLKCTVRPEQAGTEAAIGCRDFEPESDLTFSANNYSSPPLDQLNL